MRNQYRMQFVATILLSLTLVLGTSGFLIKGEGQVTDTNAPLQDHFLYLPIIVRDYPLETVFGGDLNLDSAHGMDQMTAAGISWARLNLPWDYVEATEGVFNLDMLHSLETQLINAYTRGIQVILVLDGTPQWALKPGFSCGAVAPDKFQALKDFVQEVVSRYSSSPYNVKYWEFWNEPDVEGTLGCWGDSDDTYYGGEYYGEMLKAVYPVVKAANPDAQVLTGGLLLDCDPVSNVKTKDCTPAKFLEGALKNGAGPYFDGVSFHAYDFYNFALGTYDNVNWNSAWNNPGPVLSAKAKYIRTLLDNPVFGAEGKFLINSESALLCDTCVGDSDFETTKAYYVTQAYATTIAEGLRANIWYSILGWRNSGLLENPSLTPLPGYTAYQFARSELRNSSFVKELSFTGVKAYEFNRGDRKIWVLWSTDGSSHPVTFTSPPAAIYDALGAAQVVSGNSVDVSIKPLYVEWNP